MEAGQPAFGQTNLLQRSAVDFTRIGYADHPAHCYYPLAGTLVKGFHHVQKGVGHQQAIYVDATHVFIFGQADTRVQGVRFSAILLVDDREFGKRALPRFIYSPDRLAGPVGIDITLHFLEVIGLDHLLQGVVSAPVIYDHNFVIHIAKRQQGADIINNGQPFVKGRCYYGDAWRKRGGHNPGNVSYPALFPVMEGISHGEIAHEGEQDKQDRRERQEDDVDIFQQYVEHAVTHGFGFCVLLPIAAIC